MASSRARPPLSSSWRVKVAENKPNISHMWQDYTRMAHTRVFGHMSEACAARTKPAGSATCACLRRAYLVCEEVSLVHSLVERSIILLPHLLLAAPRRDEVEATPASQLRAFSNPAKAIGKVTVLPGCRRCVRRSPARARSALVPAAHFSCVAVSLDVPRGGWSVQPAVSSHVEVHSSTLTAMFPSFTPSAFFA